MPKITKQEINLLRERNKLEAEYSAQLKETGKSMAEGGDIKDRLAKVNKQLKDIDNAAISASKSFKALRENIDKSHKSGVSIGEQSKVAVLQLSTIIKQTADAQKKGNTDLAKSLSNVTKLEEDILKIAQNKSSLLGADLDAMEAQAKENIKLLKSTDKRNKVAVKHSKHQIDQVNSMRIMQERQGAINKLQERSKEVVGQIKKTMLLMKSGPGLLLLAITAIGKALSVVNDNAVSFNDSLGIGLNSALKQEASAQNLADHTLGIRDNLMASGVAAANASGKLSDAANRAININEAVASIQFGITNDEAAKLAQTLHETSNLTREQASSQLQSIAAFAKMNNVAPKAVLADMASSSEEMAKWTDGSAKNMARMAVLAAKLGVSMSAIGSAAGSLLDLESSITAEFEASVLLNKEINLDKARQFALNNDLEGVTMAIQEQLGGMNFTSLNAIQRESLATATGFSVGDLSKIMARKGEQLEGTMEEKQLASTKDLVVSNHIQEKSLNKILTGIGIIIGIMTLTSAGKLFKTSRAAATGVASRYFGKKPKTPRSTKANRFRKAGKMKTPRSTKANRFRKAGKNLFKKAGKMSGKMKIPKLGGFGGFLSKLTVPLLILETLSKAGHKTMDDVRAESNRYRKRHGLPLLPLLGPDGYDEFGRPKTVNSPSKGATVSGNPNFVKERKDVPNLQMLPDEEFPALRGGKAKGGPITATGRYLVGEEGPELVNLSKGSHVTPNNQLGNVSNQSTPVDLTPLIQELKNATIAMKEVAINTKPIKNIAIGSAT